MLFTQAGMGETPPTAKNGALGEWFPVQSQVGLYHLTTQPLSLLCGQIHNQRALRILQESLVGSMVEVTFRGKQKHP